MDGILVLLIAHRLRCGSLIVRLALVRSLTRQCIVSVVIADLFRSRSVPIIVPSLYDLIVFIPFLEPGVIV